MSQLSPTASQPGAAALRSLCGVLGSAGKILHAPARRMRRLLGKLPAISRRDTRFVRMIMDDYRRGVAPAPRKPDPASWRDDRITAAWIGHSTVLINFYGMRILTDPVLGSRIGLRAGPFILGMKRHVAPALTFSELPPIDLILLSHAHMDHLDISTLRRFGRATTTVTAHRTRDLLTGSRLRHRAMELDWGERATLSLGGHPGDVEIEAFEVRHWGARMRTDDFRRYNGYLIRRGGAAILFAGDTAYTPAFEKLRGRGGDDGFFDLALMPIGAYDPWIANHCTPEQALEMAEAAGSRFILPVHHQTFRLSREPMEEPIERLERALAATPGRLAARAIGDTFQLDR